MTLPVGRRAFFVEVAAAACARLLWSGTVTTGAIWAAAMWVDPAGARSAAWAAAALLSLAAVALLAGVIVYTLRHSEGRRAVETVVALAVVVGAASGIAGRAGPVVVCACAGVMVLIGAAVAVAAYHRWLETDLG